MAVETAVQAARSSSDNDGANGTTVARAGPSTQEGGKAKSAGLLVKAGVATSLMYSLHLERKMFADVVIECTDRKTIYAHKAVLATRERFFAVRFFPQGDSAKVKGMQPIRKEHRAFFTETSSVLKPILEFIYTGVIKDLEEAPGDLDEVAASLWLTILTWCYRNEVMSVYTYVHTHLLCHALPVGAAAVVLALVAERDSSRAYCSQYEDFLSSSEELANPDANPSRSTAMSELKQLALSTFTDMPASNEMFLLLSREALKTVLHEAALECPEVQVCAAVQMWATQSPWVQANCDDDFLAAEHMEDITKLLDVSCLTASQFHNFQDLFPRKMFFQTWKQLARGGGEGLQSSVSLTRGRSDAISSMSSMRLHDMGRERERRSFADLQEQVQEYKDACREGNTRASTRANSSAIEASTDRLRQTPRSRHTDPRTPASMPEVHTLAPPRETLSRPSLTRGSATPAAPPKIPEAVRQASPLPTRTPQDRPSPRPAHAPPPAHPPAHPPAAKSPIRPHPPRPSHAADPAIITHPPRSAFEEGGQVSHTRGPSREDVPGPSAPGVGAAAPAAVARAPVVAKATAAMGAANLDDVGAPTGNKVPEVATTVKMDAPQARETVIKAARTLSQDGTSAFLSGPSLHLKQMSFDVTLVSSDATCHQGLLYKGSVHGGKLRWQLEVTRPCDVLWMGVSATFSLDMSQWIARDSQVYMVSEESSCLAHCSPYAVTQEDSHAVYIGFTRLPCVRCLEVLNDDSADGGIWKKVIVDLDASTGDMWMDVNNTGRQHVFKNLPTDRPLYPVVSAINTAQFKFSLLDAD